MTWVVVVGNPERGSCVRVDACVFLLLLVCHAGIVGEPEAMESKLAAAAAA